MQREENTELIEDEIRSGIHQPSCVGSDFIFMDRFSNGLVPDSQMEIRIEMFCNPECLPELRDAWMDLLADAVKPLLYLSWEWISRWWHYFGKRGELCIMLAYDGDWLVGLLPLMVQKRKKFGIEWKILTMIAAEFEADHLDILVRRGYEEVVPERILRSVLEDHPTVDLFFLSSLAEDSLCAQAAKKVHNGWIEEPGETCPYIGLEKAWEDYAINGLDKRMVRKLRGAMQRVISDTGGTMRIWRVKNERERVRAMDALFAMHNEKWAARSEVSPFASPESQAFHHEMSARLLKCGCLRMSVLSVGGVIAAVEYNIRCRDVTYSFQKAYSSAWKVYDPGYLLTQFAIQQSIREGMTEFDLLRGDEEYKRYWATGVRRDLNYWLPARPYGKVLWLLRSISRKARVSFHLNS